MKKQIDAAVREKLDQIKPKIQDIPNTVPDEMRRTFNFKGRKSPGVAEKVIETVCNKETVLYDKTTPRLIQFHTLKNAVNPPFLGGFSIFNTVVA